MEYYFKESSATMPELVGRLAELQAEKESVETQIERDKIIQEYVAAIADLEKQASKMRGALHDLVSAYDQSFIDETIQDIKVLILAEWDGKKKTIKCDAGTLQFRTTQSLKINDPVALLTELKTHTSIKDVATKYISGFNKTEVKRYMGVLDLPRGAAELESKTSVKLEVK